MEGRLFFFLFVGVAVTATKNSTYLKSMLRQKPIDIRIIFERIDIKGLTETEYAFPLDNSPTTNSSATD